MKKFAVLLFSVVIAVVASVTAFAASSPSGPVIDDKYDVVGKVTGAGTGVSVSFDDDAAKELGEDGTFRVEDITEGTHKIVFTKGDKTLDEITINVAKGTDTKAEKVSDDVYNVTVKSGVSTIYINFNVLADDDYVITNANSVGNDSPDSPPTGDYSVYAICIALMVAFSGILVSGYFKKRFN